MTRTLQLFIAISLTIGCFYWFRGGAVPWISDRTPQNGDNLNSFVFVNAWNNTNNALPHCWDSRVIALRASHEWTELWKGRQFWNIYASYNALFLFATFLLLVFGVQKPLVPMLGTVAGLLVSAMPQFQPYCFPFDMPVMFLFTAAFICYDKRLLWPLLAVVVAGGMIKESVLITALFLLGAQWTWFRRFGAIAILILIVHFYNGLLMPAGAHESWMVSMCGPLDNIKSLSDPRLSHTIFANAGGLAVLAACLWRIRDWPLRLVVLGYFMGEFCCGCMLELRIFFEVLPLGWILAQRAYPKL
jgi:hypothetical protein